MGSNGEIEELKFTPLNDNDLDYQAKEWPENVDTEAYEMMLVKTFR